MKITKIIGFNKLNNLEKIFSILMTIITMIWGFFILFQLISSIDDFHDFSIAKEYGVIALTLFGITLIGGIFEKEKHSWIEKQLFNSSLLFLISFVSLFFLSTLSTFLILPLSDSIQILLIIPVITAILLGTFMLPTGLLNLMLILFVYRKKLRLDEQ